MSRILILYGTNSGQTRKIAHYIAEIIEKSGHQVEVMKGNKVPDHFSPKGFDAAIIGTSIYMGQHQISVRKLVKQNSPLFNEIPTAYFCVCLSAYSMRPHHQKEVDQFIQDFLSYTGIHPIQMAAFAGALKYRQYNFIRRYMAKLVARKVGADTNTKKEIYEYTNWEDVGRFANSFLESLVR